MASYTCTMYLIVASSPKPKENLNGDWLIYFWPGMHIYIWSHIKNPADEQTVWTAGKIHLLSIAITLDPISFISENVVTGRSMLLIPRKKMYGIGTISW
jgi:hypothetical protein